MFTRINLAFVTALLFLALVACQPVQDLQVITEQVEPTSTFESAEMPAETVNPATPTPVLPMLTILPDEKHQTLRDVAGGNFIHRFGGVQSAFDPVSRMNWAALQPLTVRVAIDLDLWEPVNDNDDPLFLADDGFVDEVGTALHGTFLFLQEVNAQEVIISASVWRVPAWLVENPDDERQWIVPPNLYAEMVESLAAWLLRARDVYGVDVDYISFNEANLGINVLLSPAEAIDLIRLAGPRFAELGLKTRWLLGDTSNMAENVSYASAIWAAEDIRQYLGPLSFHSWDADTGDETLLGIGEFANQNGLEVWCGEGGWNAQMWQSPRMFPMYSHALSLGAVYARSLKMTRATNLLYWEMMGQDYPLNDGEKPYPSLVFLTRLKQAFPPGSQVVGTGPDRTQMKYVAAASERGIAILIVNRSLKEDILVSGLPEGDYQVFRTASQQIDERVTDVVVTKDPLRLSIEGFGITFIVPAE